MHQATVEPANRGDSGYPLNEVCVPLLIKLNHTINRQVRAETLKVSPAEIFCRAYEPLDLDPGEEVTLQYGIWPEDQQNNETSFAAEVTEIEGEPPFHFTFGVKEWSPDFLYGPNLIGKDAGLLKVKRKALELAPYDISVLLLGESGTGKSLLAEIIHQYSARSDGPLVKVNCPSIPEELLESELFGHEKGAFTGASSRKPGMFRIADGGTLVLEEISDLPLAVQAKLLQALEDKEFWSVGGSQPLQSDARIIAISNDDVEQLVQQRSFRLDLYYRLNEASLTLPPLRDRKDDIPLLAESFRLRFVREYNKECPPLSEDLLSEFQRYSWPGNVRELAHTVKRKVLTGEASTESFRPPERQNNDAFRSQPHREPPTGGDAQNGLAGRKEALEKRTIQEALQSSPTKTEAAAKLGISYRTLLRKTKKYDLS